MDVVVPFDAREPKTRLAPVLDADERAAFARAMLRDVLDALDALDAGDAGDAGDALNAGDAGDAEGARDAGDAGDALDAGDAGDAGDAEGARGSGDAPDATDVRPTVLANAPVDVDAPVTVDERPLTDAVNAVLAERVGGTRRDETGETDGRDRPTGEHVAVVMADLALATPRALGRLFAPDADVVVAPGRGGGTNALVVRHPDFRVDYHGASYRDHREIAAAVGASVAVVDSFRLATDVDEPADLAEVLLHAPGGASGAWLREAGFDLVVREGRVGVGR